MKKRIYLGEWFINSGIIGFLRILEEAEVNINSIIHDNYIEFDTSLLEEFADYYFSYFMKKYNIANKVKQRVEKSYQNIEIQFKSLLEEAKTKEEKEKNKQILEKIKTEKKYIKDNLKIQIDKVKKFDEVNYTIMAENYEMIYEIKTKEDFEIIKEKVNIILEKLALQEVNTKITLNSFKSILSKNYFGQPSFLNVGKSATPYEEQKQLMYRDYISNSIESAFLQEVLEEKYNKEEIRKHITAAKNKMLTKEIERIYASLEKQLENGKDFKKYLAREMNNCSLCEEIHTFTSDYTESNFVPLAVSGENMSNFFWNQNTEMPICDLCKLILFCIPAGVSSSTKITKDNSMKYVEKEVYNFINYDTSVKMLLLTNNNFSENSKKDKTMVNPYTQMIMDIVEQEKQKSKWKLQNIFVVEFETEYLAFSRMEYFNVKPYLATFLIEHAKTSLQVIKDYRFKLQITDMFLKDKDIQAIINNKLKEILAESKNGYQGYNCYLATKANMEIKLLKKGGEKMTEEMQKSNKKLYALYGIGIQIHEELKKKGEDNKLDGYIYRMLNSIKANNKKEFMDVVIRLHLFMKKDISPIFLEIMQDGNLDFASIGQSFLSGLVSNEYKANNIENEGGSKNE